MLDIGCRLCDILEYLTDVDYVGIDLSSKYIEAAQSRFGSRGRFISKPVEEFSVEEPASFDIVMAHGVLHHLDGQFTVITESYAGSGCWFLKHRQQRGTPWEAQEVAERGFAAKNRGQRRIDRERWHMVHARREQLTLFFGHLLEPAAG